MLGEAAAESYRSVALASLKVMVLLLRLLHNKSDVKVICCHLLPQSAWGIFKSGPLLGIISLLLKGHKQTLSIIDLSALDKEVDSTIATGLIRKTFTRCGQKIPPIFGRYLLTYQAGNGKWRAHALFFAAFTTCRMELAIITVSRLILVTLNITQPFLLRQIVGTTSISNEDTRGSTKTLVAAICLLYTSISVRLPMHSPVDWILRLSHSCFRIKLNGPLLMAYNQVATFFYQVPASRFTAKVRGSLITLIYNKILKLPYTGSDASGAVTLISTDVERICEAWERIVGDLWAGILQLSIALWLLRMQMGPLCLAPILLTFGKTPKTPKVCSHLYALGLVAVVYLRADTSNTNIEKEKL